jgi:hypothetical protein
MIPMQQTQIPLSVPIPSLREFAELGPWQIVDTSATPGTGTGPGFIKGTATGGTAITPDAPSSSAANESPTTDDDVANQQLEGPPRVVKVPTIGLGEASRFEVLQQWEGVVDMIAPGEFTATLHDLTHPTMPPEEATFDLSEVSEGDLDLVEQGAVFYWVLGYKRSTAGGQKTRTSDLIFRRLPIWSASDLSRAIKEAEALRKAFAEPTQSTAKA